MKKNLILMLALFLMFGYAFSQTNEELKGIVTNTENISLKGALVKINELNKGAITDVHGEFIISGLQKGSYEINISFLGYENLTTRVSLPTTTPFRFSLSKTPISLQEVVITDNYATNRKKDEPLGIEIVNEDYLKQNLGGSLMKSLERLPGISTIDIGSGQSKPVIRGLSFNRVVVVENNIKHEAQQWGADHGLEIDQYAVDNIEIIKGPASLMYGSDAIGGVIDMKNNKLPEKNSLSGAVDISGKTNNDFIGTSVSVEGRKEWFFATLTATLLDYGDFRVPTDSVDIYNYRAALHDNYLRNTAGNEQNLHLSFGLVKDKIQSRFYLSNVNSKSGFFANAHGLEPRNVDTDVHDRSSRDIQYPFQEVNHFKVINSTTIWQEKSRLEIDLGYQRNHREEWSQYVQHGYMPAVFPDTLDFDMDLERKFIKDIYSANVKFFYQASDKTQVNSGISGEYKENQINGRGFIIPAYSQVNIGGFVLGRHELSPSKQFQAGMRYDHGRIKTSSYFDWFPSPLDDAVDPETNFLQRAASINRSFSNFTWSLGYNYNPGKWNYKVNIGKSFRMPIPKELAANGVNYHRFSYEVGNPDLSPEIAYQLDLGITFGSEKFAAGASPFLNYFSNYIYLNPTSSHDRLYGNGNQIFIYTESQVLRYGGEFHSHYELLDWLQLGLIGEYIYSRQLSGEKEGYTLPFSPPASAIINLKYNEKTVGRIDNPYLSVDYKITAAQNNIVPPEVITKGYQVVNVGIGGEVNLYKQKLNLSIQVQNLLNKKYFNHTSYYRLINVPEPGRNFIVNINIPFHSSKTL
ncbi:TonB-dependent receptor [Cyclobacterium sp. 1_MG-2023]|uniref:TonB-dependent receptor n=1 Tax=Cyclobacterium sp. 1_MG-2023 TaxID=3062681 RepID=UPI0026E37F45|nr:TonB-dependent receptor [Cyclobacterium sp. 1_MG-2023]MDO6437798.1 TonB-dependent receptor [Cyclobacterium sp. 1_MG-2023]